MSINYMAKYSSTSSGGNGARVAKFDVDVEYSTNKALKINTEYPTASYTLTVKGSSEVSVGYKIVLKFNAPVPEGISIKIDEEMEKIREGNGVDSEFTFDGYTMPISDDFNTEHIITFNVDMEKLKGSYSPNISIDVVAEQID